MDNPKKTSLKFLIRRKVKKIVQNPKEILGVARLILNFWREFQHQKRYIKDFNLHLKGTHSSRRINSIIRARKLTKLKYLEIGLAHGYTFEAIKSEFKTGVDPFPKSRIKNQYSEIKIVKKTSDEFFAENKEIFDLIFVDGMHTFEQSYIDLINSIKCLAPGGVILLDDVIPGDKFSAMSDIAVCKSERLKAGSELQTWSGDVFKSIIMLVELHPQVEIRTIISPDHPQTLIWVNREFEDSFNMRIDLESYDKYADIDYEEFFEDLSKVNKIFNLQMEWHAIQQYISSVE